MPFRGPLRYQHHGKKDKSTPNWTPPLPTNPEKQQQQKKKSSKRFQSKNQLAVCIFSSLLPLSLSLSPPTFQTHFPSPQTLPSPSLTFSFPWKLILSPFPNPFPPFSLHSPPIKIQPSHCLPCEFVVSIPSSCSRWFCAVPAQIRVSS